MWWGALRGSLRQASLSPIITTPNPQNRLTQGKTLRPQMEKVHSAPGKIVIWSHCASSALHPGASRGDATGQMQPDPCNLGLLRLRSWDP